MGKEKNNLNEFGVPKTSNDHFSPSRMLTMTRRVLRQLARDRRTFGMIVFMPIMIMLIFGVALSGEVRNVNIVVLNEDVTVNITDSNNKTIPFQAGAAIVENLKSDDRVSVNTPDISFEAAKEKVEAGEQRAVIFIPSNFSQSLLLKISAPETIVILLIHIDATKPAISANIISALNEALRNSIGAQAIEFDQTKAFGNAEFSGLDVAVPAVMALVLTFLILMISLVTIIRERLYGTLGRLYTTPLTKTERLLGFVLALSLIGMIMVTSVFLISTLIFKATVSGNILLLLLSAFLYAITHVFLAVFLSNFAENELQAMQFAPLIAFPSMALSGMLIPLESLPDLAQSVSAFIPMTYGIKIFEGIMLKGFGFQDLIVEYLILILFTFVMFLLASFTVKDRLD